MTRLFLSFLNAPGLVLIVLIGIAAQTSLFNSYPFLYLQPDIVLLMVIWCSLKRDFTEGGILVLIFAEIAEAHSGSPRGLFMACYMLVFLAIRFLDRYVLMNKLPSIVGLTLFASVFWKLSGLLILHMLGLSDNQWKHTVVLLLPGAVMEAIVGIWFYRWLEYFDKVTFKDPKVRQAMADELQLEEEGL